MASYLAPDHKTIPVSFVDLDGQAPLLIWIGIGAALGTFGGAMYAESQGYSYSDREYKQYMAVGFILGGAAGAGAYYLAPAKIGGAGKTSVAPKTLGHKKPVTSGNHYPFGKNIKTN